MDASWWVEKCKEYKKEQKYVESSEGDTQERKYLSGRC